MYFPPILRILEWEEELTLITCIISLWLLNAFYFRVYTPVLLLYHISLSFWSWFILNIGDYSELCEQCLLNVRYIYFGSGLSLNCCVIRFWHQSIHLSQYCVWQNQNELVSRTHSMMYFHQSLRAYKIRIYRSCLFVFFTIWELHWRGLQPLADTHLPPLLQPCNSPEVIYFSLNWDQWPNRYSHKQLLTLLGYEIWSLPQPSTSQGH